MGLLRELRLAQLFNCSRYTHPAGNSLNPEDRSFTLQQEAILPVLLTSGK